MVKCPGVTGWKANASTSGMESAGKCPTIAQGGGGGWALLELTDALRLQGFELKNAVPGVASNIRHVPLS